jgi:hypothetical protein
MHNIVVANDRIPAMSEMAIDNVMQLQAHELQKPQRDIPTTHIFHAGVYARTIMIPAGVRLVGALIKVATVLIASGDFTVYLGEEVVELSGYHVFAASAGRKQAFIARTDTYLTMIFKTGVKSVSEAEEEFTDEFAMLSSRRIDAVNHVVMTGE